MAVIDEEIRVRAYYLWEADGRPAGRDLEFWQQARQSLVRDAPAAVEQPAPSKPRVSAAASSAPSRRKKAKVASAPTKAPAKSKG